MYPDGSRVLELSTKCEPRDAFNVAAETRVYLSRHGIDLSGEQQTKTKKALDFFSAQLAGVRRVPMCRWMAWLGQPVLIDELLFKSAAWDRRPEPARANGRGADQRRRVRPRLVRDRGRSGRLPQRLAGLGGSQPSRARGARGVAALPRPRARGDRLARARDELPPLPPWPLAVRAQRLHRRLPPPPARPDAGHRPGPVRRSRGLDRLRGRLPPRADVRARGGPDPRARAHGRLDRGDRGPPRDRPTRSRRASGCRTARRCGRCGMRATGAHDRCSPQPTCRRSSTCTRTTSARNVSAATIA